MLIERGHPRSAHSERESPCAIAKAVLLLSHLDGRTPVSLSTLTNETSIPKSTVRRILCVLCALRMAHHTGTGYVLGEFAADLGRKAMAWLPEPIMRVVMPHLLYLHVLTRAVVCLGLLNGNETVCTQTLHRETDVPLVRMLSHPSRLNTSALGRALRTDQPEEVYRDSTLANDVHSPIMLAMAVTDPLNRPIAAIAVAGRISPGIVEPYLREATYRASRDIRMVLGRVPSMSHLNEFRENSRVPHDGTRAV